MWSVNWISKDEVEVWGDFENGEESPDDQRSLQNLTSYLILGSDAFKFHMFSFERNKKGDIIMVKLFEKKVVFGHHNFQRKDVMRFSLSKKIKNKPIIVCGLQHSQIFLLVKVIQLSGRFVLVSKEMNTTSIKCIIGIDCVQKKLSEKTQTFIYLLCLTRKITAISIDLRRIRFNLM